MLSREERDRCEAWGLPGGEVDDFVSRLVQNVDAVCAAVRALLPESSRDVHCSRHATAYVGASGQLELLVSAAFWPTGGGGDDLLEIVYSVSWPREIEADMIISLSAEVTELGTLFPCAEQRVRCTSATSRIAALVPVVATLGRSLDGCERELADAIVTLQRHGGSWPAAGA